jgi:phage terminase Nu1 subunit (DNA packaging protein)
MGNLKQLGTELLANRTQIARILEITPPTVTEYVARGMPYRQQGRKGLPWLFAVNECVAWVRQQDRANSVEDPTSIDEARLRREVAEATLKEIELAKARSQVVDVQAVADAVGDMLGNVRARLLALGPKLAPLVYRSETLPEVRQVIDDGIHDVLSEISGAYDDAPDQGAAGDGTEVDEAATAADGERVG